MKHHPFISLYTLTKKEILRFMNVSLQTVFAPLLTTFLFYFVFTLSFGAESKNVHGTSFAAFLAPGLAMMAIMQNAFANPSSSLIVGKIMKNIRDVIVSPLTPHQLVLGYVLGGMVRGIIIGALAMVVFWFFNDFPALEIGRIIIFTLLGTILLSLLGVIGGIWAEKFDHLALMTNFVIIPLTFLSGTFYTLDRLPDAIEKFAAYNPFFFIIDGFRSGFINHAESDITIGIIYTSALNLMLYFTAYYLFKTGYKLKS